MIEMSLDEIADVVGGTAHGEAIVVGGAFVDTRTPEDGGLFVAVAGERVDGHDLAAAAGDAGAVAVLGSRPTELPTVVVDDVTAALGLLARHVVDHLPEVVVLAMTGSQGKTGTKDYLAHLLSEAGPTVATRGNFNNELGVPLTVLRATPDTRYLVVEMGARGVGHVAELCAIAPPRVAAVLNVGTAHIGEFGSREAIAQAKGEIVEALPADGTAVLNADDALVAAMAGAPRPRSSPSAARRTARTPTSPSARSPPTSSGRQSFELAHRGSGATVHLAQVGAYQWRNAAAAAAMALAAGLDLDTVADSLADAVPASRWRMELHERADGLVVVNDAYNANPESMRAALETLAGIGDRTGRRTVAVLGEMLELGDGRSSSPPARSGTTPPGAGVDVLVAVGDDAAGISRGFDAVGGGGVTITTAGRDEAVDWLRHNVSAADVVLVKASRGAALELIADDLLTGSGKEGTHHMRAILFGGGLSLLISLLGTRYAIRFFTRQGFGQPIRDDGPTTHHVKRGTPTMGGAVVVLATVVGYFAAKLITGQAPTASALLLIFLLVGLGVVGFLDDFLKVSRQHSTGLRSRAKMIGQTVVALVFGVLALSPVLEDERGWRPASDHISFIRDYERFALPAVAGPAPDLVHRHRLQQRGEPRRRPRRPRDGLGILIFAAYTLVNIWQNSQSCALEAGAKCYEVRDPLDLAVVAAALTGACFGFLWWNASPAQIILGDTGSLSLGGAMAGFAIMTRTELLLLVIGGLFVVITLSVMIQVSVFKVSRASGLFRSIFKVQPGHRVFRMTPLHHHFEMLGWEQVTIVIRFWIVTGLAVATGLGIFYAEWVAGVG